MKTKIITIILLGIAHLCNAQQLPTIKARVDFDTYEKLIPKVKAHRKKKTCKPANIFKNGAGKWNCYLRYTLG